MFVYFINKVSKLNKTITTRKTVICTFQRCKAYYIYVYLPIEYFRLLPWLSQMLSTWTYYNQVNTFQRYVKILTNLVCLRHSLFGD